MIAFVHFAHLLLLAQHYSQPPDVTSNASKSMRGADRVNRFGQTHASSIRVGVSTNLSTFEEESGECQKFSLSTESRHCFVLKAFKTFSTFFPPSCKIS